MLGATLRIPRTLVRVSELHADLTIGNPQFWKQKMAGLPVTVEPTLELWNDRGDTIHVPRHYAPQWRGVPPRAKDVRDLWRSGRLAHRIELRNAIQRDASEALRERFTDKILTLACGAGKTCTALHAASEGRRFPVLIVVHTNALMDQWREQIAKFYKINPEDVGHIQGSKADWRGKKIAVAMLHTLCLRKYEQEFYDYWRLVIFDEAHRLGAQFFMKAAPLFRAERWGLSATVEREDKMDKAFKMHLGEVAYSNLEQDLKPKVFFIETGISMDLGKYMFRGGRVNTGKLYTDLSEHPARNRQILQVLTRALQADRTILVLGERLSQLHEMHEQLRSMGEDSAIYVGSMGAEERREALTHRIVFGTQHIAREGLDRPSFDTLAILIPFGGEGRLQQSIGRILRLKDGKKSPKVLVFRDNISIIRAISNKMERSLRNLGFKAKVAA